MGSYTLGEYGGGLRPQLRPRSPLRVGVIGTGAIGGPVIEALRKGEIPGCRLGAVMRRSGNSRLSQEVSPVKLDEVIRRCDLVVEAAGQEALAEFGPAIVEAGLDLMVLSVGALVDDDLMTRLLPSGGGQVLISTGAIGGIDALKAAMLLRPLEQVRLTSLKPSRALLQPWMGHETRKALLTRSDPVEVFRGSARKAVRLFPESANVAGILALATVGFDKLEVSIHGSKTRTMVEHRVAATGAAGSYEFVFRNRPSQSNVRTSAITPYAVLRTLREFGEQLVRGV